MTDAAHEMSEHVPALPAQMTRVDQLSLAIAVERLRSAEAELRAAQALVHAAKLERRLVHEQLARAYALQPGDAVDYESGAITRSNGDAGKVVS